MKSFVFAVLAATVLGRRSSCESDTDLIKEAEGYRSCMYYDSVGVKTICYGYNLETASASEVAAAGGDLNDALNGGCFSQATCDQLLDDEVDTARKGE